MYRLNESILVNDESGDDMEISKIISIFSTNISGKCYGFIYTALYSQSISDTGESLYHIYSDNPYVEPTSLMKLFLASAVVRKVMLYPDLEMLHNPSRYVVIDYQRITVPLSTDDIIIPIYPEKGDMLKIKGIGENEVFLGHVQSVDERGHTCQVYFYEKEANCNGVIKLKLMEKVHWSSVLGLVNGKWNDKFWTPSCYHHLEK